MKPGPDFSLLGGRTTPERRTNDVRTEIFFRLTAVCVPLNQPIQIQIAELKFIVKTKNKPVVCFIVGELSF